MSHRACHIQTHRLVKCELRLNFLRCNSRIMSVTLSSPTGITSYDLFPSVGILKNLSIPNRYVVCT